MDPKEALEILKTESRAGRLYESVRHLGRDVAKLGRLPGFGDAVKNLAAQTSAGDDRLLALAALVRLQQGVRAEEHRTTLETALRAAVANELPDIATLDDPDDRARCTFALRFARGQWAIAMAARLAVQAEPTSSNVREAAVQSLMHLSSTVDDALAALAAEFDQFSPETKNPEESRAKRARVLLEALEAELKNQRAVTATAGQTISKLVLPRSRARTGDDVERDTLRDLARATLKLVSTLIRTSLSLLADARAYEPLRQMRTRFDGRAWAQFVESAPEADQVVHDLREAVILLARQGKTDRVLERLLHTAAGTEDRGRAVLLKLAEDPSLTPEIAAWFRTGEEGTVNQAVPESTLAVQSRVAHENGPLAEAFRLLAATERKTRLLRSDALPEIEVLAPAAARTVASMLASSDELGQALRHFCSGRGLVLFGSIGERVEFLPRMHEFASQAPMGIRWVEITQPGVELVYDGDQRRVLIRALVVPTQ
jgi:hypothetical protein